MTSTTDISPCPFDTIHVLETESLHVTSSILTMLRAGSSLCSPQDLVEVLFTEEQIRERTRNDVFQELIARGESQLFEVGLLEQQIARLTQEIDRVERDKLRERTCNGKSTQQDYDLVIDIPSLRKVMGEGWTVDGCSGDSSSESTESECGEVSRSMDSAVVAVVGLYNKGKTFLLNKFANSELPSSHTTPTKGLSFKTVQMDVGTNLTLVDTAGSYKPVKITDERSIAEQEMMELFLLDVVLDLSDYFISVVNDWTFIDQQYLDKVARYLASSANRPFKEIIVVHNLKDVTCVEALEDTWGREVAQVVGKLQRTQVAAINPKTGKVETRMVVWAQTLQCRHLCMVNDFCALGQDLNPWTISLLKYWLKGIVVPVSRSSTILARTLTLMSQKLSVYYRQKVDLEITSTDSGPLVIRGTMGQSVVETRKKDVLLTASELTSMDPESFNPSVDIISRPEAYVVFLTVPGFSESDLSLTRENTITIVRGRKPRSPVRGKWVKKERRTGEFTTSIAVPREYEKRWSSAVLADGVLCITYSRDQGDVVGN